MKSSTKKAGGANGSSASGDVLLDIRSPGDTPSSRSPFHSLLSRVIASRDTYEQLYHRHLLNQQMVGVAAVAAAALLAALQMLGDDGSAASDAQNQLVLDTVSQGFQSALSTLTTLVSTRDGMNGDDEEGGGGADEPGFFGSLFADAPPPSLPPWPPSMPRASNSSGGGGLLSALRRVCAVLNLMLVSLVVGRMNDPQGTATRCHDVWMIYWDLAEELEAISNGRDDGGAGVSGEELTRLQEKKRATDRDVASRRLTMPTDCASRVIGASGDGMLLSCLPFELVWTARRPSGSDMI